MSKARLAIVVLAVLLAASIFGGRTTTAKILPLVVEAKPIKFNFTHTNLDTTQSASFKITNPNDATVEFVAICSIEFIKLEPAGAVKVAPKSFLVFKMSVTFKDFTDLICAFKVTSSVKLLWDGGEKDVPFELYVDITNPIFKADNPKPVYNKNMTEITGATEAGFEIKVDGRLASVAGKRFRAAVALRPPPSKNMFVITSKKFACTEKISIEIINIYRQLAKFTIGSMALVVDGKKQTMQAAPLIKDGGALVHCRSIQEAMPISASFNQSAGTIKYSKGAKTMKIYMPSGKVEVDGKEVSPTPKPQAVSGETMVPVKFIAQTFSFTLLWDGTTKTITVQSDILP